MIIAALIGADGRPLGISNSVGAFFIFTSVIFVFDSVAAFFWL